MSTIDPQHSAAITPKWTANDASNVATTIDHLDAMQRDASRAHKPTGQYIRALLAELRGLLADHSARVTAYEEARASYVAAQTALRRAVEAKRKGAADEATARELAAAVDTATSLAAHRRAVASRANVAAFAPLRAAKAIVMRVQQELAAARSRVEAPLDVPDLSRWDYQGSPLDAGAELFSYYFERLAVDAEEDLDRAVALERLYAFRHEHLQGAA